jgi:hypothetical protein
VPFILAFTCLPMVALGDVLEGPRGRIPGRFAR